VSASVVIFATVAAVAVPLARAARIAPAVALREE
jgi:ABC-type antimicrobial peptide transport system permease subunit